MLPEKPWNLDAVLRLFLGVLATFFLGSLLAGLVAHLTSNWPKTQSDFCQIVISVSFLEFPALGWIAWFLWQQRISWKDAFGFQMSSASTAVAYGVLAGALFVPAAWGLQTGSDQLMQLFGLKAHEQEMVQQLQNPDMTAPEKAFMGAVAIVLAPIVEEMFFRGILYPAIKKTGCRRLAWWLTSGLFALAHYNAVTFVPLMIFSLVLIRLYETFENLLASIVAHGLFNAANFFVLIFQNQITQALHLT